MNILTTEKTFEGFFRPRSSLSGGWMYSDEGESYYLDYLYCLNK